MRIAKLVRYGTKITNSTNPIVVVGNITLTVIDYCSPPPIRLAATCVAFTASLACSATTPNPVTIGVTAHFANEIYLWQISS